MELLSESSGGVLEGFESFFLSPSFELSDSSVLYIDVLSSRVGLCLLGSPALSSVLSLLEVKEELSSKLLIQSGDVLDLVLS